MTALKQPTIPDFRFEYSYIHSIKPFVGRHKGHSSNSGVKSSKINWTLQRNTHINESANFSDSNASEGSYEKIGGVVVLENNCGDVEGERPDCDAGIVVQWKDVVWVTFRDQVVLPLVQGALWGVVGYWIPSVLHAGGRARDILRPHKEGSAVGWLRGWVQNLGFKS